MSSAFGDIWIIYFRMVFYKEKIEQTIAGIMKRAVIA